jgi:DNA replication and repair protein RecF
MPLLLLDEVASHLDAQRRQDLIEALHALKVQAWLTGTDALLFADFAERAQWLVIEDDGAAAGAGSSVRELNAGRAVV